MGCKCGRDIFGENEIIKAESFKANYNKRNRDELSKKNNSNVNNMISNYNSNDNKYNHNYNNYNINKYDNNDNNLNTNNYNNNDNNLNTYNYNYNNNDNNNNIIIQNNNIIKPELNILKKDNDETLIFNNMNGSQKSSLTINSQISKKNDYPQKIISLINEIRSNPLLYSKQVEESIKNIKITKNNRIIYCNVVKVALHRGEEAFREAIDKLRNTDPMPPLRYNPQLCIPLPENETELNQQNFLKEQVEKIRQRNTNIEIYFKDLIKIPEVSVLLMIVDDNSKNTSKKRDTLLNKDFRYIGINSTFIGKTFVAHFSFSR